MRHHVIIQAHNQQRKRRVFTILSNKISVFIFSSPRSSHAVGTSGSSAIIFVSCAIKSEMRIGIPYKIVTPIIFMTHSPTGSTMCHDVFEGFVLDFFVLIDDTPGAISGDFLTSFTRFPQDFIADCPI